MMATLSADNLTVTLAGRLWLTSFPIADLPAQITFYSTLCRRGARTKGQDGPWGRFYRPTLTSLESVAHALRDPERKD